MNAPSHNMASPRAAHLFRSKFLDSFSRIEHWTIWTCRRAAAKRGNGKIPPQLGNRITAIRELIQSDPGLFASPIEIGRLLDRLDPYCRLRTTLVHGRIQTGIAADGITIFIVDNPLDDQDEPFARRVTLRSNELNRIIQALDKLADDFVDQV